MGKTPGKWIKTLLGKKTPKSSMSKGNGKLTSDKEEAVVVSLRDTLSNLSVDPPLVTAPVPAANAQNLEGLSNGTAGNLMNGAANLCVKENEGDEDNTNGESQNKSEETKHQRAAAIVQAAYRGHRDRRAFHTLKGIIRLQAVIRGHLVRRQAVATYSCVWGIVKFQALIRGRKVRCSDTAIKIAKRQTDGETSEASRACSLMVHPFVQKLLASSPTRTPLRLQYGHGEPNSAWAWLERWTKYQIWNPNSLESKKPIPNSDSKKDDSRKVETGKGKPKRIIRKVSEKRSDHSTPENEKIKRSTRMVSAHPVPTKVHSKPDTEKVKPILRKSPKSLKKATDEKKKSTTKTRANGINPETDKKPPDDKQAAENNGPTGNISGSNGESLSEKNDLNAENTKVSQSQRRVSLPAKINGQDDGLVHSAVKVPSYMAPTKSAKARVRGQGSPRLSQELVDKDGITTRRHSLPSSANGKLSTMSPRAQRLVLASGRGSINGDISLSSSRDAGEKITRAGWKR